MNTCIYGKEKYVKEKSKIGEQTILINRKKIWCTKKETYCTSQNDCPFYVERPEYNLEYIMSKGLTEG